ncbi:lactonase family protein [Jeotgalicoccus psychrophilus]|uniref:lactonase family protein n=1 Tax=Jeotgalicoccus psychrophilus TaxID=157228 RepID=UPI000426E491|nr:lactonase family protein [Jeotgalicoccus psychrophilus]
MIGYIDTYTQKKSKGIYRFTLDPEAEELNGGDLIEEFQGPLYLDIQDDKLYSLKQDGDTAGIATFEIADGELKFIDECLPEGENGCYLTASSDGKYMLDAVYDSGKLRLYKMDERGIVVERLDVFQVEGNGPHERQDHAHSHFVTETPDGKYFAAVDLGADKIVTFSIEEERLVVVAESKVAPGSGPRHLVFSDAGDYAYILTELSNEVIAAEYNDGAFSPIATYSLLPEDFTEHSQAAAIRKHPNGKYIYASNRGHNSIAVFEIKDNGKSLNRLQIESSNGNWPRDFNITPDGQYLVCAHEKSHNLVLFKINKDGTITRLDSEIEVPEGIFIGFI